MVPTIPMPPAVVDVARQIPLRTHLLHRRERIIVAVMMMTEVIRGRQGKALVLPVVAEVVEEVREGVGLVEPRQQQQQQNLCPETIPVSRRAIHHHRRHRHNLPIPLEQTLHILPLGIAIIDANRKRRHRRRRHLLLL